ncbi:MAG: ferrous iron transporter B [Planctomycetota bacterium]|nr:ferrous iron transporter B [Planctomycetota bacterium]
MKKVLLFGNPNVGKSALFSRLTGASVTVSNYPGTTVEYTKGTIRLGEALVSVEDVPGTYSLEPASGAEKVAVEMLNNIGADGVILLVLDSTTLERGLFLALQVLKRRVPTVIALNMSDEARHIGVSLDVEKLQRILGVPCVRTVAITGVGVRDLVNALSRASVSQIEFEESDIWRRVGEIIAEVQVISHRHHTLLERLGDATVKPLTGIPFAILMIAVSFLSIRYAGEVLVMLVEPVFERHWASLMLKVSAFIGDGKFVHDILIGRLRKEEIGLVEGEGMVLVKGKKKGIEEASEEARQGRAAMILIEDGRLIAKRIDYKESFGLLTTGLYVEFCAILPYVLIFFLVLSLLEDTGYLPRLAVLIDSLMHRVGLHGMAVVPMVLGLGCNVPGLLSIRVLESERERFIAATLMVIAVPCMAQLAMLFGLAGEFGLSALVPIFVTLFIVWTILGVFMKRVVRGESPEILLDVPPYRVPYWKALLKKNGMRIFWFLRSGVPWVLAGILIANISYTIGIIEFLGNITAPLITGALGLPKDAVVAILMGFLRKDVAVGMLVPFGLTLRQTIVASVVLTMFFPCVASFAMLIRELGLKDTLKAVLIMVVSALIVGALLNQILSFLY